MALYDNTDFYYTMGKDKEQDNKIRNYLSKSTQLDSDEDYYISSIANELIDIVGPEQAASFVDRYLFTQDSDECMRWLFKKLEPYAKHASDDSVREFIKDHENDLEPADDDEWNEMAKNYPLIFGDNNHNPTGIANPADYVSKVTFEEDTDGDGDIDKKVTKIKDSEED